MFMQLAELWLRSRLEQNDVVIAQLGAHGAKSSFWFYQFSCPFLSIQKQKLFENFIIEIVWPNDAHKELLKQTAF